MRESLNFVAQNDPWVKVTMDINGNKLLNMVATERLCASLLNLADM